MVMILHLAHLSFARISKYKCSHLAIIHADWPVSFLISDVTCTHSIDNVRSIRIYANTSTANQMTSTFRYEYS